MDGVNNAFCMSKEEYELARLATKCAGLQGKIDDQAAEIKDYKTWHDLDVKQLAYLFEERAMYIKLCDLLGNAMELHNSPFLHHELRYEEALTAWRNSK